MRWPPPHSYRQPANEARELSCFVQLWQMSPPTQSHSSLQRSYVARTLGLKESMRNEKNKKTTPACTTHDHLQGFFFSSPNTSCKELRFRNEWINKTNSYIVTKRKRQPKVTHILSRIVELGASAGDVSDARQSFEICSECRWKILDVRSWETTESAF